MSTQRERIVRIEHPTGRRAAVTEHAFKHARLDGLQGQTYEEAGYKIVSYEDGTEYKEGAEPTKYGLIGAGSAAPEIGTVAETEPTRSNTRAESAPAQARATADEADEEK